MRLVLAIVAVGCLALGCSPAVSTRESRTEQQLPVPTGPGPKLPAPPEGTLTVAEAQRAYESDRLAKNLKAVALALYAERRFAESRESFKSYLAVRPGDADALAISAFCLVGLGQLHQASEELASAARANPKPNAKAYLFSAAGLAAWDIQRAAEAEAHYRAALQADPQDRMSLHGLGLCLAHAGDLEGAIQQFRAAAAVSEGEDRARAMVHEAKALLELGRDDAARQRLAEASGLPMGDATRRLADTLRMSK